MAPRQAKTYTEQFKGQAIAGVAGGMSLRGAAVKFAVPITTLRGWVKGGDSPLARSDPQTKQNIYDHIIAAAESGLATYEAILTATRDPALIKGQNARDLAILLGVIADKSVKVGAALERGEDLREAERRAQAGRQQPGGAGDPDEPRPLAANPPPQAPR